MEFLKTLKEERETYVVMLQSDWIKEFREEPLEHIVSNQQWKRKWLNRASLEMIWKDRVKNTIPNYLEFLVLLKKLPEK